MSDEPFKELLERLEQIEDHQEELELFSDQLESLEAKVESINQASVQDKVATHETKISLISEVVEDHSEKLSNIKEYDDTKLKERLVELGEVIKESNKYSSSKAERGHKHTPKDIVGLESVIRESQDNLREKIEKWLLGYVKKDELDKIPRKSLNVGGFVQGVRGLIAGTNVTIDDSDPRYPIINALGGGGGSRGSITGTLADQTDLQAALDAKTSKIFTTSTDSGTSLTLAGSTSTATVKVFTGASNTTWTLPAVSYNTDVAFILKNRGTANIALNRAGSDNIYYNSAIVSITIYPGESYTVVNDGVYWLIV